MLAVISVTKRKNPWIVLVENISLYQKKRFEEERLPVVNKLMVVKNFKTGIKTKMKKKNN